jgi:hypothetical protein
MQRQDLADLGELYIHCRWVRIGMTLATRLSILPVTVMRQSTLDPWFSNSQWLQPPYGGVTTVVDRSEITS